MQCKDVCNLCKNLVISQGISFTNGNLVVNLPAGSYADGRKICVIFAQTIPAETTINAPVLFTIGDGTETYPLTNKCCNSITACGIRTRTKYSVVVSTNATGGVFRMLGKPYCTPDNRLSAINGTAPTPTPAPASAVERKGDK